MTALPKALYRGSPTTTSTQIAVPTGKLWIITNVVASNYSTEDCYIDIRLDGVGFVPEINIVPGGLFTLDCAQVLSAGKLLYVVADVDSALGVSISGVEMDA